MLISRKMIENDMERRSDDPKAINIKSTLPLQMEDILAAPFGRARQDREPVFVQKGKSPAGKTRIFGQNGKYI